MAHYPRNFIQRVIFRLDFPICIKQLEAEERPVSFQRVLLQKLPIAQEHQQRGIEFRFTPDGQESHEIAKTTYHFLSDDEARKVALDRHFLFVEENRFVSFEAFRKLVVVAIDALFATYVDTTINRLGLRYLNVIPPDPATEKGILAMIPKDLVAPLSFYWGKNVSRLLTTYEKLDGSRRTRVTTGWNNPDYPSVLNRLDYLIDIDVHTKAAVAQDSVLTSLDDFQEEAKRQFARCTTAEVIRQMQTDEKS